MSTDDDDLITIDRLKQKSSVSSSTINRAIADGRLNTVKIGRAVRIRMADARAFMAGGNKA